MSLFYYLTLFFLFAAPELQKPLKKLEYKPNNNLGDVGRR